MKQRNFDRALSVSFALAVVFFSACSQDEKSAESPAPVTNATASSNIPAVASPATNQPIPIASEIVSSPDISGKIIFKGTPPPARDLAMDPTCGALHKTPPKLRLYMVGDDGALADVFVYIKEGLSGKKFSPPEKPALLDQSACEYLPYVVGLQTNQKLLVRNSDPLLHNVHCLPKVSGNKESNRAQTAQAADLPFTFENPELFLTFKCDVHNWMYAYVCVVENPFFAVTGKDGSFTLKNVPPGKYVIEAVHRKAGKQTKEITIGEGPAQSLDFTFELPAA